MKKFVIAINAQKKSGKTTFVRSYSELLARKGVEFATLHTGENDSFPKSLLWDVEEEPDDEFLLAQVEANDVVILDVASEHVEHFTDYLENSDIYEALAELDAEITVAIPNRPDINMSADIVALGEFFSDSADYVIAHAATVEEDHWTGSPAEKAMHYLGAVEIELPELNEEFSTQLSREYHLSLSEALGRRKELPRFLRDELHRWELGYSGGLETAGELLIPREKVSKSVYGNRFASVLDD